MEKIIDEGKESNYILGELLNLQAATENQMCNFYVSQYG